MDLGKRYAYNCSDCRLFCKPSRIACNHDHRERETSGKDNDKAVPHETSPDMLGWDLPDHDGSNQRDDSIQGHPVGSCVFQVRAAKCRYHNKGKLESGPDHLNKKGIEFAETKAFDHN
jgi:hypothetical protein